MQIKKPRRQAVKPFRRKNAKGVVPGRLRAGQFYERKLLWLSRNRGILTKVAKQVGMSPQFVRECFWGERHNDAILGALIDAGAPIK